ATVLRRWTEVVREDALETRISRLLTTRRGVVLAIDDERRRIERDLHDGVQQNVVSLSVMLARARRAPDPARAAALLEQAHSQSQSLIEEVRQVAWRVYPSALDEHGLATALGDVASSSPVPTRLDLRIDEELPRAVESAAYFVVREAVNNVVKHAGATQVAVRLVSAGAPGQRLLTVTIRDDGAGGADPEGGGLQGLARRVAALDGTVRVDSPHGGPTVITAELPCGRGADRKRARRRPRPCRRAAARGRPQPAGGRGDRRGRLRRRRGPAAHRGGEPPPAAGHRRRAHAAHAQQRGTAGRPAHQAGAPRGGRADALPARRPRVR